MRVGVRVRVRVGDRDRDRDRDSVFARLALAAVLAHAPTFGPLAELRGELP